MTWKASSDAIGSPGWYLIPLPLVDTLTLSFLLQTTWTALCQTLSPVITSSIQTRYGQSSSTRIRSPSPLLNMASNAQNHWLRGELYYSDL